MKIVSEKQIGLFYGDYLMLYRFINRCCEKGKMMREILYKYNNRGLYQTDDNSRFGNDDKLRIVVEPHSFSLTVGGELLRKTFFEGCAIDVSNNGEAVFYDNNNQIIGKAVKSDASYEKVLFSWEEKSLVVMFGKTVLVDYYPNCDGEYDRWGEEWKTERTITMKLEDNSIDVK